MVIALKVLTHHYLKQVTKEEPLLLLDDVLSELDEGRQQALLANLPTTQILMTCTTVPQTLRKRDDVYLLDVRTIVDRAVQIKKKHLPETVPEKTTVKPSFEREPERA